MNPHQLFIGAYTESGGRGIYAARLDGVTGALSEPTVACETIDPSWITVSADHRLLYAVNESRGTVSAFSIGSVASSLTPWQALQSTGGGVPCHLAIDHTGRVLVVSNFGGGSIGVLPLRTDGSPGPAVMILHHNGFADPVNRSVAHVHCVAISPDNRFALVCDLGLDRIYSYRFNAASFALTPADPAFLAVTPGSGPRHAVFAPSGRHVFVINEKGSSIVSYGYDPDRGMLVAVSFHSTLPDGYRGPNDCSEIRVHPNGKFVYGANRGHNSIAVYEAEAESGQLALVEIVPCGGTIPRHFALSPDGKWLVCIHQGSDSIAVFGIAADTGRLTRTGGTVSLARPACVVFYD